MIELRIRTEPVFGKSPVVVRLDSGNAPRVGELVELMHQRHFFYGGGPAPKEGTFVDGKWAFGDHEAESADVREVRWKVQGECLVAVVCCEPRWRKKA